MLAAPKWRKLNLFSIKVAAEVACLPLKTKVKKVKRTTVRFTECVGILTQFTKTTERKLKISCE